MLALCDFCMLEHGYLRGNKRIPDQKNSNSDEVSGKSSQRRILMDLVIETISKCSDEYDDSVQLQVLA